MALDTLKGDTLAAQHELELLKKTSVNDIRKSVLFPLIYDMEWVCRVAEESRWVFEGLFCGASLGKLEITYKDDKLEANWLEVSNDQ